MPGSLISRCCALLGVVLAGCQPGYQQEGTKWLYVRYNSAVGRDTTDLHADAATFRVLPNDKYAHDKNHVFWEGDVLPKADPATFAVLDDRYSKDQQRVYLQRDVVIGADPGTFQTLEFPYSRDAKTAFCGTVPLLLQDLTGFRVTQSDEMTTGTITAYFIRENPEYAFLDTVQYPGLIYGDGRAATATVKFAGFKRVK